MHSSLIDHDFLLFKPFAKWLGASKYGLSSVATCFTLFTTLVLFSLDILGQSDSTLYLQPITISQPRQQHYSSGLKLIRLDSSTMQLYKSNNLSELLSDQSSLFVKNYGPGTLATPSLRGGSAFHTAVLWNGFNIASPTNGNLDLALIKNFLIDDVSILYGGGSTLTGSGAVSGTILLRNYAHFGKGWGLALQGSVGSFQNLKQNISIQYSGNKWTTSLKMFRENALNNYDFYHPLTKEKRPQTNNQLKQSGFLLENYWKINNHEKLSVRYWYQESHRQIPPSMFQTNTGAKQEDMSHRITAEFNHDKNKISTSIRTGFFHELLNYSDASLLLPSNSKSNNLIAEAELRYEISSNHELNVGINNTYMTAASTGYNEFPHQNRTAFFATYKLLSIKNKFITTFSGRQEIVNSVAIPFTYSVGSNYNFWPGAKIKVQGSTVYRIPTFNDLYWAPGGNVNLKPENGFSGECGLQFDMKKILSSLANRDNMLRRMSIHAEVTYYAKRIKDWILWMPSGNFWEPRNIMLVYSRGVETNIDWGYKLNHFDLGANAKMSYTRSTKERVQSPEDASLNRQLVYVPMYLLTSNVWLSFKRFYFNFNFSYCGYRFTSNDNYQYLNPYSISNIQIAKTLQLHKHIFKVFGKANNIFNSNYQVMQSRPMPLRNFEAGIIISFNHI